MKLAMALAITATSFCATTAVAQTLTEHVIAVPGFADFLAVDGDTVWATNRGRVEHWSRDRKLASVRVTRPCGAMTIADGSLWVADCAAANVVRVDLATASRVATIPTGIANRAGELNVASGAGSIWVASASGGAVSRIDPATNKVVATVKVDPDTWYLAFGFGALWAVSPTTQSVQKIDPATNKVVASARLGAQPGFLAAGEGGVWIQEQGDGTLAKVDPDTGAFVKRIKVDETLKWGDIDTGGGKVWLRTTEGQTFVMVDAATMEIDARMGDPVGSGALRYTPDGIWTSAHDKHTLSWWSVPPAG